MEFSVVVWFRSGFQNSTVSVHYQFWSVLLKIAQFGLHIRIIYSINYIKTNKINCNIYITCDVGPCISASKWLAYSTVKIPIQRANRFLIVIGI